MRHRQSEKAPKKARKKPQQQRSQQMVDDILVAAARILERHGSHGLTTNEIARQAGVSIGSLYQYFPNKESIDALVVEKQLALDFQRLTNCLENWHSQSLEHNIRHLIDEMMAIYCSKLPYRRHILVQNSETKQKNIRTFQQTLYKALLESQKSKSYEITQGNVEIVFQALRGVIQAYISNESGELTEDQLRFELTNLLLRYLSASSTFKTRQV